MKMKKECNNKEFVFDTDDLKIERKNKTYLFSEPANQVYRANVIAVAIPILPDGPFSAVRSIRRFR